LKQLLSAIAAAICNAKIQFWQDVIKLDLLNVVTNRAIIATDGL
jgi:hypothetical protein